MQSESKEDLPPTATAKKARYSYISQKILLQFQPSIDPNDIPYEQIAWWKMIFSYIQPNDYERLHLRRLCNMFKASLKATLKGVFTEFPHPNHASIDSLFNRLHVLHDENPTKAPTIIFIKAGEHVVEGYYEEAAAADDLDDEERLVHVPVLKINYPMKIIGAGRDKTFIVGGSFRIGGMRRYKRRGRKKREKNDKNKLELKGMTVRNTSLSGLISAGNNRCLSFLCDSVTFTQCGESGVWVANNGRGRLINCSITQCGSSGILCSNGGLIELEGNQTRVEGNVTSGRSTQYGLESCQTSSKIHLLFPLTKESVSTNNCNGQNYCSRLGGGPIQTVQSFPER
jgi:hypothetical protein